MKTGLLRWISLGVILLSMGIAVAHRPGSAAGIENAGPMGAIVGDLKDQLENGLKARRPQELAFISKVVTLVEQDKLPMPLVKAVFQWARERGAKTNYPFPYFERAIKIRAKKLGIIL